MNLREIAEARAALAAKLEDGSLKPFGEEYSAQSGALDQLAAAARLRLDAEANERHEKQVASAILANAAIAANQEKLSALLQDAKQLVNQGADSTAALRELVQVAREASFAALVDRMAGRIGRLWESVKQ